MFLGEIECRCGKKMLTFRNEKPSIKGNGSLDNRVKY